MSSLEGRFVGSVRVASDRDRTNVSGEHHSLIGSSLGMAFAKTVPSVLSHPILEIPRVALAAGVGEGIAVCVVRVECGQS